LREHAWRARGYGPRGSPKPSLETEKTLSKDRILTTHAGSLPRPPELIDLFATDAPDATLQPRLKAAVDEVVRRQAEVGIDVVDDGEYGKATRAAVDFGAWASYATQRLGGWETGRADIGAPSSSGSARLTALFRRRDWLRFDEFCRDERGGMGARSPQGATTSLEAPQFCG